jgi:hypothetical protein
MCNLIFIPTTYVFRNAQHKWVSLGNLQKSYYYYFDLITMIQGRKQCLTGGGFYFPTGIPGSEKGMAGKDKRPELVLKTTKHLAIACCARIVMTSSSHAVLTM